METAQITPPRVFQVLALRQGLLLLARGIKPNTAWSLENVLATASRLTAASPPYKGRKDIERARADLAKLLPPTVVQ